MPIKNWSLKITGVLLKFDLIVRRQTRRTRKEQVQKDII